MSHGLVDRGSEIHVPACDINSKKITVRWRQWFSDETADYYVCRLRVYECMCATVRSHRVNNNIANMTL